MRIKETILTTLFILSLFLTHIPATNNYYSALRTFIFIILLTILFFDKNFRYFLSFPIAFRVSAFFLAISIFLAFFLIPSENISYGFQKFLTFIFDYYPSTLVLSFFLVTTPKEFFYACCRIFIFGGIFLSLFIILQGGISYLFLKDNLFFLGHIGAGKFLTYAFFISVLSTFINFKKKNIYMFFAAIILLGLYFCGLRNAVLTTVIGVIILLFNISRKYRSEIFCNILKIVLFSVFPIILISLVIHSPEIRYLDAVQLQNKSIAFDGSIYSRVLAFNDSINIIKENFLFGIGLGGYNNIELRQLKYPHNIFLEIFSELGIIGITSVIFFLFYIFRKAVEINFIIAIFIFFSLSFAFFSGSLQDQKLLFIWGCLLFFDVLQLNQLKNILNESLSLR